MTAAVYLLGMATLFALITLRASDFARDARQVSGTVVALVARAPLGSTRDPRDDAQAPSLAPKVGYTVDGRSYTFTAAHGRYRQRLRVGDTVTVLYAPDDPSRARLSGEGRPMGPVISLGFALGALGVVVVLLLTRPGRMARPFVPSDERDEEAEEGRALAERSSNRVS